MRETLAIKGTSCLLQILYMETSLRIARQQAKSTGLDDLHRILNRVSCKQSILKVADIRSQ